MTAPFEPLTWTELLPTHPWYAERSVRWRRADGVVVIALGDPPVGYRVEFPWATAKAPIGIFTEASDARDVANAACAENLMPHWRRWTPEDAPRTEGYVHDPTHIRDDGFVVDKRGYGRLPVPRLESFWGDPWESMVSIEKAWPFGAPYPDVDAPKPCPAPECGQVWFDPSDGSSGLVLAVTPPMGDEPGSVLLGSMTTREWPPFGCQLVRGPGAPWSL